MEAPENIAVPPVDTHTFFMVYATYGQTMGYVQSFEALLKMIVSLYNFFEKEKSGPITPEEYEEIFSEHANSPLGKVLNGLQAHMGMVEEKLKQAAMDELGKVREARNDLAHSYLVRKEEYMKHEEGRELVIAQLRHYASCFKLCYWQFRQILDHLLDSFIGPKELRDELSKLWDHVLGEQMKSMGLKYFRDKLTSDGVL